MARFEWEGRIIPALAGNTPGITGMATTYSDHPRSRGEYGSRLRRRLPGAGSSPLSRGIPALSAQRDPGSRIIPALAGNTRGVQSPRPPSGDHPRSRGEYSLAFLRGSVCFGLSPLSRGIPDTFTAWIETARIIPALAGNTWRCGDAGTGGRDHPRSRGEYQAITIAPPAWAGSSPLSRGIRSSSSARLGGPGIIPALAGNTRPVCHRRPR